MLGLRLLGMLLKDQQNMLIQEQVLLGKITVPVFAWLQIFTIHPGNHHTLPEGLPEQSNPTRGVIIKQLKHIHPSLYRERT